jgi:hypothetical protein
LCGNSHRLYADNFYAPSLGDDSKNALWL